MAWFGWVGATSLGGRATDDEFGLDESVLRAAFQSGPGLACEIDLMEDGLRCEDAHVMQGLAYGREAWVLEGGAGDVVEADDRDVFRDAKAGLAEGADCADRSGIVEGEERGEAAAVGEQALRGVVAGLVCGDVAFELGDELGIENDAELRHGRTDGVPANTGVGAEGLPLDEGDAPVAKAVEVLDGERSGTFVIEQNVGDAFRLVVTGHGDGGNGDTLGEWSVDCDEPLDGAGEEQLLILFDELGTVVMAYDEVEEILVEQALFDSAQDECGVSLADFGDHDADSGGPAISERASEDVGLIAEMTGGLEDFLLGCGGDGLSGRRSAEDARDGCGGQAEVGGDGFEADGSVVGFRR